MATPRSKILRSLTMPVADQAAAERARSTQEIQFRQAVAAAPRVPAFTPAAQQLGASAAAQRGEAELATGQAAVQRQQQIQQLAGRETALGRQQALAGQELALGEKRLQGERQLAELSEKAAELELNSRLNFMREKGASEYLTERNYMDYAARTARSQEQLRDYAQAAELAHQRKMQMLQLADQKLREEIDQQSTRDTKGIINNTKLQLLKEKAAVESSIAKAKAEAANKAAMRNGILQVAGTTVGGVAGFVVGGPAGAMAGAQIGGSVLPALGQTIQGVK